jgi:hypothetical protein
MPIAWHVLAFVDMPCAVGAPPCPRRRTSEGMPPAGCLLCIHSAIVVIMPFHLLGMSEASTYVLYCLIAFYLLLSVYTVLGGWPRAGDRQHIRLLWFLALPTTLFLALWFSGRTVWTILWWLLYWGDAGPYERYGVSTAGLVAVIVPAILLARLATGRVSRNYVRFNTWGVGLCAVLFGAFQFIDFADGIDGWTARGAAENKFAHLMEGSEFYPARLPRRIVDETTPYLASHRGRAFALYIGEARTAEVQVMPYYRWWWTVSSFRNFPFGEGLSTQEQLRRFHESLKIRKPKRVRD